MKLLKPRKTFFLIIRYRTGEFFTEIREEPAKNIAAVVVFE
jgi:hypothetical protein